MSVKDVAAGAEKKDGTKMQIGVLFVLALVLGGFAALVLEGHAAANFAFGAVMTVIAFLFGRFLYWLGGGWA